jgi:flagellar biosynthesis chaperone FliJ
MTVNRRTVRALCDVRERMREIAAAEHSSRSQTQLRAEEVLAAARRELECSLDHACGELEAAGSVDELDRVAQQIAAHHEGVEAASAEVASAVILTAETAQRLRARASEVASASLILERCERESSRRAQRQEQRILDDQRRRGRRDTTR